MQKFDSGFKITQTLDCGFGFEKCQWFVCQLKMSESKGQFVRQETKDSSSCMVNVCVTMMALCVKAT